MDARDYFGQRIIQYTRFLTRMNDHIPDIPSPQEQAHGAHLPPPPATDTKLATSSPRPLFREAVLDICEQNLGLENNGDQIPMLVFEAATRAGVKLAEDPSDYARLRAWARETGATVDIPAPGDIAIIRYGFTDRYWGGVVRAVHGRDAEIYASQPFHDASDNILVSLPLTGYKVNNVWSITSFIRL